MESGLSNTTEMVVSRSDTAVVVGSGDMEVLATPAMIALMENAAMNAVARELADGYTTVGTEINVSHVKASPVGAVIKATAELVAVEGRKLTFRVTAADQTGMIGGGTHTRYVVEKNKFLSKIKNLKTK